MKRATCRFWSQKVKGHPPSDFLVALISWQDILIHLGQYFFLLCTWIQDDERKTRRKFEDKLTSIKDSKGRCPKALDDFTNFSILCQVGRFTYVFCYQFLMVFRWFGIFPLDRTGFVTFIIPGSWDIAQVVRTVKIELPKFRFTEQGSNFAFVLKTSRTTFTRCKKGHVILFKKIIQ